MGNEEENQSEDNSSEENTEDKSEDAEDNNSSDSSDEDDLLKEIAEDYKKELGIDLSHLSLKDQIKTFRAMNKSLGNKKEEEKKNESKKAPKKQKEQVPPPDDDNNVYESIAKTNHRGHEKWNNYELLKKEIQKKIGGYIRT